MTHDLTYTFVCIPFTRTLHGVVPRPRTLFELVYVKKKQCPA